jgi:Family of unknown function (DUF5681)
MLKQARGRFQPGQSGNPKGRRRGAANKETIASLIRQYGSPIGFLLATMADTTQKLDVRIDCAKAVLPFTNRRLPEFAADKVPPITPAEEDAELAEEARREKVRLEAVARAAARKEAGPPPEPSAIFSLSESLGL